MTSSIARVACLMALIVAASAAVGCGGRQTPPAQGTCHPWREWVPPERDSNGQWRDGYCRDRPGVTPGEA